MARKRRSATDIFVKGDIATTPQPTYIIYLYFKALYFNSDYRDYWINKTANKIRAVEKLEKKYNGLAEIASLFGNVFGFSQATDNDSIIEAFADWFKVNGCRLTPIYVKKYKVVRANEPLKPKSGTVYFTAPEKSDPTFIESHFDEDFEKSLKRMQKLFTKYWLPLEKTDYYKTDKLQATARRLDIYVWRHICGLSDKAAIFCAYESGDSHWDKLKTGIDTLAAGLGIDYAELTNDDLQSYRSEFSTTLREAKKVVKNAVVGKFPSK